MDGLNSVFSEGAINEATTTATDDKKQKIQEMKKSLKETLNSDATFTQKLHSLSNSIKVVNTLGYGNGGNIVVDKAASTADNRVLKPTSAICGYRLQNIGKEAIQYTTEEYAAGADGKYVGTVVQKTWAPGATIDLTRTYTTMLCSIPEISFTLANGKIVASSRKAGKKGSANIKDELASYYFSFNKDGDEAIQVNDDSIKLRVDEDGKVKPEFVATFGYLNNPKEGRGPKANGPKFTTQDLAANYVQQMLKSQGM